MLRTVSFVSCGMTCDLYKWVGQRHRRSEDRLLVVCGPAGTMIAALDGMGGLPHAYEAAQRASAGLHAAWRVGTRTPSALLVEANHALVAEFGPDCVGVTAAGCVVDPAASACGGWIGDVRIAVASGATVDAAETTRDHTRVAERIG